MLDEINISNILFLDIETVPIVPTYEDLKESMRKLWDKKAERVKKYEDLSSDDIFNRAGIYAEFGKIICVSCGIFRGGEFRIKSFYGEDEKELLAGFADLLNSHYNKKHHLLCAHNGKEFDYPYIARRMLINGIKLPDIIDIAGKKPWEIAHLDTLELWKFGDYKSYTSIALLSEIFNIPTPKDDIDGSDVARVFWQENDIERIVKYCQKDVLTVAQLFRKYQGKELIDDAKVKISS